MALDSLYLDLVYGRASKHLLSGFTGNLVLRISLKRKKRKKKPWGQGWFYRRFLSITQIVIGLRDTLAVLRSTHFCFARLTAIFQIAELDDKLWRCVELEYRKGRLYLSFSCQSYDIKLIKIIMIQLECNISSLNYILPGKKTEQIC